MAIAALSDLITEFELTMQLHHPNVLLTMAIVHGGQPAADTHQTGILMERMVASLVEVVERHAGVGGSPLTWRSVFGAIIMDVCKGMSYLHGRDVLHRDLKPANILVNEYWVAKVADFGSALARRRSDLHGTAAPSAVMMQGTLAYMAPEMIARRPYRGELVDAWSLGVCVAAMLIGALPFTASSDEELRAVIASGHYLLAARDSAGDLDESGKEHEHQLERSGRMKGRHEGRPDSGNAEPAAAACAFVASLLTKDPSARSSVVAACKHAWLRAPPSNA